MYTKGENIEGQILNAIHEVLKFKDPDSVKASIILNRIRTILKLKDLAAAPELYKAWKELMEVWNSLAETEGNTEIPFALAIAICRGKEALAKADGKEVRA